MEEFTNTLGKCVHVNPLKSSNVNEQKRKEKRNEFYSKFYSNYIREYRSYIIHIFLIIKQFREKFEFEIDFIYKVINKQNIIE